MKRATWGSRSLTALCSIAALTACAERDPVWDAAIDEPMETHAIGSAAAIIDAPADRALLLQVDGNLDLEPVSLPIGQGFAAAASTPDRSRLLVLSRGVVPRRHADDEGPSLTMISDGPLPVVEHRYELSDPLSGLAIDPQSNLAVIYADASDNAFVQNPNELLIVDLDREPAADNPMPVTLRSFGGRPQTLTFTPTLDVPGGERRLLVVETDRDVALLDLDDLSRPDITIKLTGGSDTLTPGGIAVSDGAPDRDDDTRIAVRLQDNNNVIVVDLIPMSPAEMAESPQTFRATPNVVFVGGEPSDISFVQTDGGLRLAAVVPSQHALILVDPDTGIASEIALGANFERISLITSVVGSAGEGSDVALLWSTSSSNVAFVALGSTVGKPYKAVELLELPEPIASVHDIPSPLEHLKILKSSQSGSLVVLDLLERTAAPISAADTTRLSVAPVGSRAWISGNRDIARLDLNSLHPLNLELNRRIQGVFDVERGDGGRALIALHGGDAGGATILDADEPSLATSREYAGLLLGGLQ